MKHLETEWRDIVSETKNMKQYKFSSEKWENHLGGLTEGDFGMIHGLPGGGKTYYTLQLCKELQKTHGDVLFIEHEETKEVLKNGIAVGHKFRGSFGRKCEKIKPDGVKILPDFPREANGTINGNYLKRFKFVLIDSATVYKMDYEKMKELASLFPKTVFIFIYQSVKGGSHRGSQSDPHGVDFVIEVVKGMAHIKKTRLDGIDAYDIFEDFPSKKVTRDEEKPQTIGKHTIGGSYKSNKSKKNNRI